MFSNELGPVLAAFDDVIGQLKAISEITKEQLANIEYLECYRMCLAETNMFAGLSFSSFHPLTTKTCDMAVTSLMMPGSI